MTSRQVRILYLTSSWPGDRTFGGQLRTLHVGRALQRLGDVTLAVVSTDVPDEGVVGKTGSEFVMEPPVRVEVQPVQSMGQRVRRGLDPHFMNVHGCVADPADTARIVALSEQFDLVWLSNSRTPNILNVWDWPHSVLDIDDLPSTFQRTVWQNGASLREKLKAGVLMMMLRRREERLKQRFNALAVCSEADRQYLGGGEHIHVIPNGFERPLERPLHQPASPPRIGFIGLYSYLPNREGVRWFLEQCWRRVKAQVPNARLRLVGKDTDGPLRPEGEDVDALGWVENPAAEIATWSAMIVPVRHGAGTRVKIADAFSRKCPVVATSLGAFGYDVENGRELLLADTPEEFAAACVSLIKQPALGTAMAERAFAAFLKNWTWDAIAPRVWAAAEDALRNVGR